MKRGKRTTDNSSVEVPGVDLAQLERLLAFMSEHGLEEFEYAYGDLRIRLKKAASADSGPRMLPRAEATIPSLPQPAAETPAPAVRPPESASASPPSAPGTAQSAADTEGDGLQLIKSPIVGTFYSSSSPGAEPFVKLGDRVEPGQIVCIVEAMKLMNEIEADVGGEVAQIFLESGQPVEYGEPLFAIRPGAKK
ncbi:MAG: acetyl-CoA carboxylase biotin carboxyl carrier protein [Candidatus Acidiferrales bacterium]